MASISVDQIHDAKFHPSSDMKTVYLDRVAESDTDNAQDTVIDLRTMKRGSMRKRLESMDINHDNKVSLTEVLSAMKEKMEAENNLKNARQLIMVLAFVILVVVGATVGLTYVVVQKSITMKPDVSDPSNPVLTVSGSNNPVQVFAQVSSVNVPLGAFHLLPDLLYNLNQISFHEPNNGNAAEEILHVAYVQSVIQRPTQLSFSINCNDGTTVIVNGFVNATVTKKDGTSFPMCAACATCIFQSIPETTAVKTALDQFYAAVPDVVAACTPIWTDSVHPSRRRDVLQAQISFCASCREQIFEDAVLAQISNTLAESHWCGLAPSTNEFGNNNTYDFGSGMAVAGEFPVDEAACDHDCAVLGSSFRKDLIWRGSCEDYRCICKGFSNNRRRDGTQCGSCATGYYWKASTSTTGVCTVYSVTCSTGQYWSNMAAAASTDRICTGCSSISTCPAGQGTNGVGGSTCTTTSNNVCGACTAGSTYQSGTSTTCEACSKSCPTGTTGKPSCTVTAGTSCPFALSTCSTTTDNGVALLCSIAKSPGLLLDQATLYQTYVLYKTVGAVIYMQYQLPATCGSGANLCILVKQFFGSSVTLISSIGYVIDLPGQLGTGFRLTTSINDIYFAYDNIGRPTVGLSMLEAAVGVAFPASKLSLVEALTVKITFETGSDSLNQVVYTPGTTYAYINPLSFVGSIAFVQDATGNKAKIIGLMQGVYYQAFGLEWLHFQNVGLQASFYVGNPYPVGLELAGSMYFGSDCFLSNGAAGGGYIYNVAATVCAGVSIQAGVDFTMGPPGFGFYAQVQFYGLTVNTFLLFSGVPSSLLAKIPPSVLQSGFPRLLDQDTGLPYGNPSFSFSTRDDYVWAVDGAYIDAGFHLNGKLNILGVVGYADIKYDPKQYIFKIKVALPAFKISTPGGLTLITAGRSAVVPRTEMEGDGPMIDIYMDFINDPMASTLYMSALIGVLGVSVEGSLIITSSLFSFQLQLYVFADLQANCTVSMEVPFPFDFKRMPVPILTANFTLTVVNQVLGAINSFITRVSDGISTLLDGVQGAIGAAVDAVAAASTKLNQANADCASVKADTAAAMNSLNAQMTTATANLLTANNTYKAFLTAQAATDAAYNSALGALNGLKAPCSKKNCGTIAGIPYPCGVSCTPIHCGWGGCNGGSCKVNMCTIQVPDAVCYAANAACDVALGAFKLTQLAASAAVDLAQDATKAALQDTAKSLAAVNKIAQETIPALTSAINSASNVVTTVCSGTVGVATSAVAAAASSLDTIQNAIRTFENSISMLTQLKTGVQLYSISFTTPLSLVNLLTYDINLAMVAGILGGAKTTYNLTVNLGDLLETAVVFLKATVPGFRTLIGSLLTVFDVIGSFLPSKIYSVIRILVDILKSCGKTCHTGTGTNVAGGASCTDFSDRVCGNCGSGTFNVGDSLTCNSCTMPTSCANGTGLNGVGGNSCSGGKSNYACGFCPNGTFNVNGLNCVNYTRSTCLSGQYVSGGGASADVICLAYTQSCRAGSFWANSINSSSEDKICSPCEVGKFSNSSNMTACTKYTRTTCDFGQFFASMEPDTETGSIEDQVCRNCTKITLCPAGQGLSTLGCTGYQDNYCSPCIDSYNDGTNVTCMPFKTVCQVGSTYVSNITNVTKDRTCIAVKKTCSTGTGVNGLNGKFATYSTDNICGTCPSTSFSNDGTKLLCGGCTDQTRYRTSIGCLPMSNCSVGMRWFNQAASQSTDRICVYCWADMFMDAAQQLMTNSLSCAYYTRSCSAGSYWANSGSGLVNDRVCATCPDGKFSTTENEQDCTYYTTTTCNAGTRWANIGQRRFADKICQICEAGTFSNTSDASSCMAYSKSCVIGTIWTNSASSTSQERTCTACVLNSTFSQKNNTLACIAMTICPPGTYWTNNPMATGFDRICVACPDGYFSNASNVLNCTAFKNTCTSGQYWSTSQVTAFFQGYFNDNASSYDLAGNNTYNSSLTEAGCMEYCYNQKYTYFGLQNGTQCFCGNSFGTYGFSVYEKCNSACSGNVSSTCGGPLCNSVYQILTATTAERKCTNCPGNTFSNTSNALNCTGVSDCPAGSYQTVAYSSFSDRLCAVCPNNSYSATSNSLSCTANTQVCDKGTFWSNSVNATLGKKICKSCNGSFTNTSNQIACQPYAINCRSGSYWSNPNDFMWSDRICTNCTSGTFSNLQNQLSCTANTVTCATGTFWWNNPTTTYSGQMDRVCQACSATSFSNKTNVYSCSSYTDCQPGSYWVSGMLNISQDRTCVSCPSNTFSTYLNTAVSCTAYSPTTTCPAGTYWQNYGSAKIANKICTMCPSGTFSNTTDAYSCTSCLAGSYSTTNQSRCTAYSPSVCAVRTYWQNYANVSIANKVCTACDTGKSTASTDSTKCCAYTEAAGTRGTDSTVWWSNWQFTSAFAMNPPDTVATDPAFSNFNYYLTAGVLQNISDIRDSTTIANYFGSGNPNKYYYVMKRFWITAGYFKYSGNVDDDHTVYLVNYDTSRNVYGLGDAVSDMATSLRGSWSNAQVTVLNSGAYNFVARVKNGGTYTAYSISGIDMSGGSAFYSFTPGVPTSC